MNEPARYKPEDFLPLHGKTPFEQRMRVHQQWWAWRRVRRPMGQARPGQPFPVLLPAEQDDPSTCNFLTRDIHTVALSTTGLRRLIHFDHVLSSLPMALNLFGFLVDPSAPVLATTLLEGVFPGATLQRYPPAVRAHALISSLIGHPVEVSHVDFEVPGRFRLGDPRRHPLGDGTSADVLIEYLDQEGPGIIVIETKLTEPLSNGGDLMDPARTYRLLYDANESPFTETMSVALHDRLAAAALVQWTRNHLLALGLQRAGRWSSHRYWVVFPGSRDDVGVASRSYRSFLAPDDGTFAALSLEDVVAAWDPLLVQPAEREWLEWFRERYLLLEPSEALWSVLRSGR